MGVVFSINLLEQPLYVNQSHQHHFSEYADDAGCRGWAATDAKYPGYRLINAVFMPVYLTGC